MRLNQNLQNRFIKTKNKIYLNGPQFSLINPTYFYDRNKIINLKNHKKNLKYFVSFGLTDPLKLTMPLFLKF